MKSFRGIFTVLIFGCLAGVGFSKDAVKPKTQTPTLGLGPQATGSKCRSTVPPKENFNAKEDAEKLKTAMRGFGTDEEAIINIIGHRSIVQRLEIADVYKSMYGKKLTSDLKSELEGNFETLTVALLTSLPEYYAKELNNAVSGIGTDELALVEMLTTLSNYGIKTVAETYEKKYGKALEKAIKKDTSGQFRKFLVSLTTGTRDESTIADVNAAKADAERLFNAGRGKWGTDESAFNAILVTKSYAHLRKMFEEYEKLAGHTIETAIEKEFHGSLEKGYKAVVSSMRNKAGYFAERLFKAMDGIGTDNNTLIRIIVSRSEIDLGDIKEEYLKKYKHTLESKIEGDISGDYKKLMLAIVRC